MYGRQEPSPKLHATTEPLHSVFQRDADVTGLVGPEWHSGQGFYRLVLPTADEANEKRQTGSHQQRRLVGWTCHDEEVRRTIQELSHEGIAGTESRWVYCSNIETMRRQSTEFVRCYLLSYFRNQGQRIHSPDQQSITRLSEVKIKMVSQFLGLYIPIIGSKSLIRVFVSQFLGYKPLFFTIPISQELGPFINLPCRYGVPALRRHASS